MQLAPWALNCTDVAILWSIAQSFTSEVQAAWSLAAMVQYAAVEFYSRVDQVRLSTVFHKLPLWLPRFGVANKLG